MRQPRKMTLLSVSVLALLSRIMTDGGVRCGCLIGHGTIYYPHHTLLPISLDDLAMIILSRTIQQAFFKCWGRFLFVQRKQGWWGHAWLLSDPPQPTPGVQRPWVSKTKARIWVGRRQCNVFCLSFLFTSWAGKQLHENENSRGTVAN